MTRSWLRFALVVSVVAGTALTVAAQAPQQPAATGKPVVQEYGADVPPVMLSAAHARLCKVRVGEVFPSIELPTLDGGGANLESLAGPKATVIVFWTADRWMSEEALRDVARLRGRDGVGLVGIATGMSADQAQKKLADVGAKFTELLDAEGTALAQVGENSLPRVYVLDAQRRIAWFDIEYSESTRRELEQSVAALTAARRTQ